MAAKKKTNKTKKKTSRRSTTAKKTTRKKVTKKKTTKKKTTKRRPAAKKKATKKKTAKRRPAAKKKATKKKTAKRRPAAKKKATKKKTTKKKTTKKKTTRRRPAVKKATKNKAAKRRPAAKKKTAKRRPTARKKAATRRPPPRTSPRRKATREPKAVPLRGVSQFRCYLRELDRAIDRTDRWLSAVERQSRDLTAEFGDKLGLVAKLDEVLTEDQRTLDAVRDELGKVNEMTPAISDLQRRIGQAAGTVSGMRDQLQQIAKARGVENLLEWARGSASDLLAKASCVSTAHRLGASTRSCGTRLSVDSAEQILDAARHRDFPALTQWVVTAQTPLVPGGSIPPTEEDYDRARARIDRTQGPPPLNTSSRPAANASGGSSSGSPPAPPLPSPKPARATAPPLPGDSSEQRSLNLDAAAVEAQIRDATGI